MGGDGILVILELKKVNGPSPPSDAQLRKHHDEQLRPYVTTRQEMEKIGKKRDVVGFLVFMYDDGRKYIVENLP
jgi:hypothetical protein